MGGGTLLKRRRYMSSKDKCPYQRIDYLEVNEASDGQPYIETGYIPTGNDIDISAKYMFLGYSNGSNYLAWYRAYSGESYECFRLMRRMASNSLMFYPGTIAAGGHIYVDQLASVEPGTIVDFEILATRQLSRFNGIEWKFNPGTKGEPNFSQLVIFADLRTGPHGNGVTYARCYNFRLEKAGVPVLDLIPVRVGSEGYMYNRINGQLLGNSGSGKFILGPDIP